MLNGNVWLEFDHFNIFILVFAYICVLVQSASEEIICRGYLFKKILKDYKKPIYAILFNSVIFSLFHIFNDGISVLSLIGIFFVGILLSLLTYYSGSIWEAIAFHTMWNYTQAFIFGLPNSGSSSLYSIFRLLESKSGFAYHEVFGVEGTILSIIIDIVLIVIIQLLYKKRNQNV